jgi:hypothetical protein
VRSRKPRPEVVVYQRPDILRTVLHRIPTRDPYRATTLKSPRFHTLLPLFQTPQFSSQCATPAMIFLRGDGPEQRPQFPYPMPSMSLILATFRRLADTLPPDLPEPAALIDVVKNEPFDRRCCQGRFGSQAVSQSQSVCSRMACEESGSIRQEKGGQAVDRRVGR